MQNVRFLWAFRRAPLGLHGGRQSPPPGRGSMASANRLLCAVRRAPPGLHGGRQSPSPGLNGGRQSPTAGELPAPLMSCPVLAHRFASSRRLAATLVSLMVRWWDREMVGAILPFSRSSPYLVINWWPHFSSTGYSEPRCFITRIHIWFSPWFCDICKILYP